jgi:hypothetical protein
MSELSSIEDRLSACADGLAEAAVDLLREAMRADDDETRAELVAREKRVTRARRAVEKAISLLQGASNDD